MSSLRSGHQGLRSERLHRGDCAKIVFSQKGAPVPERMWVKVGTVRSNGSYSGTLSNEPVFLTNVHHGSRVNFRRSQVIDTAPGCTFGDDTVSGEPRTPSNMVWIALGIGVIVGGYLLFK